MPTLNETIALHRAGKPALRLHAHIETTTALGTGEIVGDLTARDNQYSLVIRATRANTEALADTKARIEILRTLPGRELEIDSVAPVPSPRRRFLRVTCNG